MGKSRGVLLPSRLLTPPKVRGSTLYSDSEQRRLYSNDPSLQFMADQVEMRIVWPAATWRP
jgi:hypothetical protein